MPLNIIIVGGGIVGCSAGIGFARKGHRVRIYERRAAGVQESGSGIQLQPNAMKIIDAWKLRAELEEVAVPNTMADIRTADGNRVSLMDYERRGTAWFTLRKCLQEMLRNGALREGCEIIEGTSIQSINTTKPSITLSNGSEISADLLIGADGTFSKIRQTLFPSHPGAVLANDTTWQIQLDLKTVESDPVLRTLVDPNLKQNTMYLGPGLSWLSMPAPKQGIYDLEPIDHEFSLDKDEHSEKSNMRVTDLAFLKERWKTYPLPIRKALDVATSAYKWRFAEVKDLPAWSSQDGRVVLVGDAAHAMLPYAGQGSAMGIEDTAVLSELLSSATPFTPLKPLISLYEKLRRPRVERVQKYAKFQGDRWATSDSERIKERERFFKVLDKEADPLTKRMLKQAFENAVPDQDAEYGTPGHVLWLNHYDVFEGVRKAMLEEGMVPGSGKL